MSYTSHAQNISEDSSTGRATGRADSTAAATDPTSKTTGPVPEQFGNLTKHKSGGSDILAQGDEQRPKEDIVTAMFNRIVKGRSNRDAE